MCWHGITCSVTWNRDADIAGWFNETENVIFFALDVKRRLMLRPMQLGKA